MNSQEINREEEKLDDLYKILTPTQHTAEVLAHWAKYLCILTSAYIENSIRIIVYEYSRIEAPPYVANYINNTLKRFRNPKTDRILEIVGYFNLEWKKIVKRRTYGKLADSINSIVSNRHNIAHGAPVNITCGQVNEYYENAKEYLRIIMDVFNN